MRYRLSTIDTFRERQMTQTSQPSAAVLSAIIEGGNGIMQTKYAFFADFAISVYDHILTFDLEVEHIWKRKFTLVTLLFLLVRKSGPRIIPEPFD